MNHDTAQLLESSGRFVIERELGQGGMGVVYQALDLERDTRVALKALSQKDAVNIYRLKNEFRQLADLSHPNLVSLHELVYEGDSWFFTMELVEGQTFDQYVTDGSHNSISSGGGSSTVASGRVIRDVSATLSQRAIGSEFPLPRATANVRRLRSALRQLVEALAALHNAGKLHRDIKPSNVLVTPEGRVVVLDFGLVSNKTVIDPEAQDENRTVGGCAFGTPAYMSPEQAAGETITPASDWYSAGAILYEALTGQLPFDGTVLEILRQKEELEPVPPCEVVKGVPDDLDQLCRDLLRRDPAKRPIGPEILRYLTGHSAPPPIFDAQSATHARQHSELFVGRAQHLVTMREAFGRSKAGEPVTVLVHGLSGMGKSALARCFANELIKHDEAVVLRGRCYERETVPYKAFDNIIDALSRYMMRLPAEEAAELLPRNIHSLARLFPVLRRVKAIAHARRPKYRTTDARELRNQAFAALKDLLLRITDFQPVVIQIDDLQWADMDSARLLSFLMGPPDPPALLLMGAYRRDEAENSPFLRHILGEGGLTDSGAEVIEVAVDPLGNEEASQLTAELLRDQPTANALFSASIAREAEGVPFFIAELVQHLKARSDRGHHHTPVGMDSISLDEVIAERVRGMPRDAQRLLEVLSVAAGPIEQGIALEAAGLPPGERASMLSLRAARLIRTRGTRQTDTAETYHDRVRETVVAGMHADAVRVAHARIAHAIESWDVGDPERLVEHYTGAGDGIRAGETAIQAAHAAGDKLAFNRAAELYRRAIELLPPGASESRELHERLGQALANAGRGAQAAEALIRAAEGAPPAEMRRLQRLAAQQYLRSGRMQQGGELAKRLLSDVGIRSPKSPAGLLAAIVWNRGLVAAQGSKPKPRRRPSHETRQHERVETLAALFREFGATEPLTGALLQAHYLRSSIASGDPAHLLQAFAWQAFMNAWDANERGAHHCLDIVGRLAREVDTPYAEATAAMARAGANLFLGKFTSVREPAARAEAIFREQCTGASWERVVTTTFRFGAIEQTGGFQDVLLDTPHLEREGRERDDRFTFGFLALSAPLAHLLRDDPEAALRLLEEQRSALGETFDNFHMWVMNRTVDSLIYAGRAHEACDYLDEHWEGFSNSPSNRLVFLRISANFLRARALLARMASESDRHSDALLAPHVKVLRKAKRPDADCLADLLDAGVHNLRGRKEHAQRLLERCVGGVDEHQMPAFARYAELGLAALNADRERRQRVASALADDGVSDPDRWVSMFAPGLLEIPERRMRVA